MTENAHRHSPKPAARIRARLARLSAEQIGVILLLGPLTLLLAVELIFALEWRMVHDTPNLHYVAFLIDRFGYVPYRDIFETNTPGTYLFHLAIGKLFGYGDQALRWVDLAWLLALLGTTWAIMRRFGRRVAWGAAVLFGLAYLQQGPDVSLQRDIVGILPVALALLLALSERRNWWGTAVAIGVLFGLTATIKPHLAIGLPLLLIYAALQGGGWRPFLRRLLRLGLLAGAGLLVPVAAALLWIWRLGAWPAFIDLFTNYLPLYLQLGKGHSIVTGTERIFYLLGFYRTLGGFTTWLIPAALGLYLALFLAQLRAPQLRGVVLLAALTLTYSIYPVFSGQFFKYHWLPFLYFVTVTAAFALIPLAAARTSRVQRLFPVVVLGGTLLITPLLAPDFGAQLRGGTPTPPKQGHVDDMAAALREAGQQPGDMVQPLDWTGGAIHAMLLTEARLATPFIYDYYFYHHVSEPYIQNMRQRFITTLEASPPPLIIENSVGARVQGPNTSETFPELREFIAARYRVAVERSGFTVYALR